MKRYTAISLTLLLFLASSCEVARNVSGRHENDVSWCDGFTSQMFFTSFVFSLLFIFITILILLKTNIIYDKLMPKIIESRRLESLINYDVEKRSKCANYNEITRLDERLNQIESDVKKLNETINQLEKRTVNLQVQIETKQEPPQQESSNEVFYLSTPNSSGSFNASSASTSYRESASIYKLTKISSSKAEFEIDTRPSSIRQAIQFPDRNIVPVCEAENAFNIKTNRIVTVERGLCELQNHQWIVNKKAKIRYE